MKYYLLDENKNLVEGFDKEGFLALLEQAIEQGTLENIDENSAVASKIRSVLNGTTHHIEFVTQAQYNQLVEDEELVANTYYFITDDTTAEDINDLLEEADERLTSLEGRVDTAELNITQLNGDLDDLRDDLQNGDLIPLNATNAENTSFTNSELQSRNIVSSANYEINRRPTSARKDEDLLGLDELCLFYFEYNGNVYNFGLVVPPNSATSSETTKYSRTAPVRIGGSAEYCLVIKRTYMTATSGITYTWNQWEVYLVASGNADSTKQTSIEGTLYWKAIK